MKLLKNSVDDLFQDIDSDSIVDVAKHKKAINSAIKKTEKVIHNLDDLKTSLSIEVEKSNKFRVTILEECYSKMILVGEYVDSDIKSEFEEYPLERLMEKREEILKKFDRKFKVLAVGETLGSILPIVIGDGFKKIRLMDFKTDPIAH